MYKTYKDYFPLHKLSYFVCFSKENKKLFIFINKIKLFLKRITNNTCIDGPIQYYNPKKKSYFYWKLSIKEKYRSDMQKNLLKLYLYLKKNKNKNIFFKIYVKNI